MYQIEAQQILYYSLSRGRYGMPHADTDHNLEESQHLFRLAKPLAFHFSLLLSSFSVNPPVHSSIGRYPSLGTRHYENRNLNHRQRWQLNYRPLTHAKKEICSWPRPGLWRSEAHPTSKDLGKKSAKLTCIGSFARERKIAPVNSWPALDRQAAPRLQKDSNVARLALPRIGAMLRCPIHRASCG